MTSLWRVSLRGRPDRLEELRATFLELAPDGFEERDVTGATELAVYVETAELDRLRGRLPDAAVEPVEDDWEEAWRAFHRPVEVAGVWLGPPWETPPDGSCAVVIDPGRAFGTGAHPTTRLCIELLARITPTGSLLDVGCGSGVLAIAAAVLGHSPVTAVDHDPVAIEATLANAAANGVEVDARRLDATADELPPADLVLANIAPEPVAALSGRLRCAAAITSGYLAAERLALAGFDVADRREAGGWAADLHLASPQ